MSLDAVIQSLRLPQTDTAALQTEYGNLDSTAWCDGMDLIAMAVLANQPPLPPEPQCEPWRSIWHTMRSATTDDMQQATETAISSLDIPLQMGIISALTSKMAVLDTRYQSVKLGSKFSASRAKKLGNPLMNPPDRGLQQTLETILTPARGISAITRYANAESCILTWLNDHGKFVSTPESQHYYLWHDKHRLFELDTETWHAWLHELTGINPAGDGFSIIVSACKTAAVLNSEIRAVVKLAYYDNETRTLRISKFNGQVYVLDGSQITLESNGDGPVLFDDLNIWEFYDPDFQNAPGSTDLISKLPNWPNEKYAWAYQVWIQSLFFNEMCPTKPILVLLGEKGSGKSMALRVILRLLFGKWSQVSGVPDKPDAFAVTASHYHLYAMDNLDTMEPWLQDKLARIATGATDEYRKLYTSKDMGILRYRCWIAVTARTPDTLRRDDLADRLLLLPLNRVQDNQRKRESLFLEEVDAIRNMWWGDLLLKLNQVVAKLQISVIPVNGLLRMADWEALGRLMSQACNQETLWNQIVDELKNSQNEFLADGEIVIEGIENWLQTPYNEQRWVTARDLYTEIQVGLFNGNKPDSDWPRSVKAFGKRLKNIQDVLKSRFGLKVHQNNAQSKYYFDHK